jgi:hypothetical protein
VKRVNELIEEFGVEVENELSEEEIRELEEEGYASWMVANIICGIEED